jgi:hypothetical protein
MGILSEVVQNRYILLAFVIWDGIWRGLALWQSAKKSQKYWFIALLIVNSMGLLPIIYLLISKYLNKPAQKTSA